MSTDQANAPAKAKDEKTIAEAGKVAAKTVKSEPKKKQPKKSKPKTDKNTSEGKESKKEEKVQKKDEAEDKVVDEKDLTINLRHAYLTYGRKAAPKAVRLVKKVSSKVFNTDDVKIDDKLNQALWSRGKTKIARKVSVKVQKLESGTVRVRHSEA
ncbi:MAG: 60S ribosomal protein L31 [Candidatus Methanomethylicus sp.]|nr:60S ribosomal protein L31 [Candidatus Methanomethylicus sp.]